MRFVVVIFTALGLISVAQAGGEYVTNYQDIVKKTDWKQMKTVTVELDSHSCEPDALEFKAGQPYRLVMRNISGEDKHYFTAPEFFRAIATRKVQSNKDGEIKAPYFTALEMMKSGGQLDLYFVPVKKGAYPVYCTIGDHREQGMEGKILIN
ncbi:MAG: hypothetical protein DRQ37_08025 [Gammaproteobacteria bacterium]|nr:MAG: hypothetical protein DRQ37_08025 [Gammaproteobacteria bacterium]